MASSTVVSVRLENELLEWLRLEAANRGLALGEYLRIMIARGAMTARAEEELDNLAIRIKQQVLETVSPLLDALRNLPGTSSETGTNRDSDLLRETAKRAAVAEQLLVQIYAEKNKLSVVDTARERADDLVMDYVNGAAFRTGR